MVLSRGGVNKAAYRGNTLTSEGCVHIRVARHNTPFVIVSLFSKWGCNEVYAVGTGNSMV